jgi:hypothetical protein
MTAQSGHWKGEWKVDWKADWKAECARAQRDGALRRDGTTGEGAAACVPRAIGG